MTKTRKLGLIAALTLGSAISLPRSSYAQIDTQTWTGIETIDLAQIVNAAPDGGIGLSWIPATLTVTYQPAYISGDPFLTISINGTTPSDDFFVTSAYFNGDPLANWPASATISGEPIYYLGKSIGSFDTTGADGLAGADLVFNTIDGTGNGVKGDVSFQTIPEPSSIVTLATGLLGLAAAGAYRRRRLRRKARA